MMIDIPAPTVTGVYEIAHGVSLEWLHGGRMYIATISSMQYATVEAYIALNKQIARDYPANQLVLTVQDASQARMGITTNVRQRTTELWETMTARKLHGHIAFVFSRNPITSTFSKLFINNLNRSMQAKLSTYYFHDRQQAIEFLESKLGS